MPDGEVGKSPLASAFPVYENFYESFDNGGVVPMPEGKLLGGHSSMIYGWKTIDNEGHFENFGSWGRTVGDKGVFHIPETYPFYPNDWFLVVLIATPPQPTVTKIVEEDHWAKGLINGLLANDGYKYWYGREVK